MTYVLSVLDPEDLLPEVLQIIEGGLGRDGVDQSEALAVLHVEVSHRSELLLKDTQVHRHTVRQTDSQTDRQSARQALRRRVRQFLPSQLCPGSLTCTAVHPLPLAEKRDRQAHRQSDRQTERRSHSFFLLPNIQTFFCVY